MTDSNPSVTSSEASDADADEIHNVDINKHSHVDADSNESGTYLQSKLKMLHEGETTKHTKRRFSAPHVHIQSLLDYWKKTELVQATSQSDPKAKKPVQQIGRAVQQECRDRSRMPSSA
eukprot:TRINITY_DN96086_c0_g1_i1.p1 TRINITY_DN96086_c0_g1~~TRINITY_DN96086_c0_g1_i1.p1  ORF type:complete len:119 (+),score=15.92 TRINITY_DN96086_c0_g1_i1:48-404(+)